MIVIAVPLLSICRHSLSPQSKNTTILDILALTTLTVTGHNVKSHDTIKLRELRGESPQKGLAILLPFSVSPSDPQRHFTKMRRLGVIINLELWQLNHFV